MNEKLLENDKITVDILYRAKAEKSKLQAKIAEAEKINKMSAAYLNFLVNKPLDSEILYSHAGNDSLFILSLIEGTDRVSQREEIQQIDQYLNIKDKIIDMNRYSRLPTLVAVADYGVQGEEYKFTDKEDFFMGSLVLKWDLFKGFQNKSKIQQSIIDNEKLSLRKQEVQQQISLQILSAYYDLEAVAKSMIAAESEVLSAQKTFEAGNRLYREGMVNYLQYIDALTSVTEAEQRLVISKSNYQIKLAEYELATASYEIPE